jgi:hypothetical protein
MRKALNELWTVFWNACKETPKGMFMPFVAFWHAATHNPVLGQHCQNKQKNA